MSMEFNCTTAGVLDLKTGVVVLKALARENREPGTTTLAVTHNLVIAQVADRVVHLSDGKITEVEVDSENKSPLELIW